MVKKKILLTFFLIILLMFSSFFGQAKVKTLEGDSEKFYLWAVADTHSADHWDDDVSFNGNTWSGNLISEDVERIDYAFIAGDITLNGDSTKRYSKYLNETCSCLLPNRDMSSFWNKPADERIWGFCMGNHDAYLYDMNGAAAGLGLDSSKNWYNNDVIMGQSYNYTALKGNLLFVYMGGDRQEPNDYSYNLPRPGDFYWLENTVKWADDNRVNVIVVTHTSIFNGSNSYGLPLGHVSHDVYYDVETETWQPCDEHKFHICDFDDPWPGDSYWTECDDYWDLIKSYGNINLWFNGHVHTSNDARGPPPHEHAGWDTTLGVERNVQKSDFCTFVNIGAVFAWGMPWSHSRVLIFSDGSKSVDFKSYDHLDHEYGHDTGWDSSHQDITITNCLKYPYDPDFKPNNNAPNKPDKPVGEKNGQTGNKYQYYSKTSDIDGDEIFYLFSWSDGSDSGWLGPYNSDETCYTNHTWQKDGAYIVRVKAKDIYESESVWSDSLNVVMPKYKNYEYFSIFDLLIKLLKFLKN